MDISLKPALIAAYRRYGFSLARDKSPDGLLVFTLKNGYFDNAEIVKLTSTADTTAIFDEFTRTGFACTVRDVGSPDQTEQELFRGFFSVESTRQRLLDDYSRFAGAIVKPYGPGASYTYIKAPYEVNGQEGTSSPPDEILARISDPRPILFLIEAAAGFGKTCTALEIVKLLADRQTHLPLYAELSRNRQARIFRYILLDEIDRTFPLLSSGLVQTEIKNGRVATILDGFDELLRKNEETGEFENKEPMLETVSELLTGSAKVIITTRRTVLFDGDEFHQWLDRHSASFDVVRIRIHEPKVEDWLSTDRRDALAGAGISVENIANPVLLSYLRCIDSQAFQDAVSEPESIVDSYFTYMLERERERQDLRMSVSSQQVILGSIAKDMMGQGYTAESRDYIVNLILSVQPRMLDETRLGYPASDRPSREEIANKLASHALLDRSNQHPDKITFINEFALGHYVARTIFETENWLDDDLRFIEPAVRAFRARSQASRDLLFSKLNESLQYLDISSQIEVAAELTSRIPFDLKDGEAEGVTLDSIDVGQRSIRDFQFNDCTFKKCHFLREGLSDVTFLSCRFYDCTTSAEDAPGSIYVLGGTSMPDIVNKLQQIEVQVGAAPVDRAKVVDTAVLRRFWPVGETFKQRPSRPIYKPMKFLCTPGGGFSAVELFESVERLKKLNVLVEMNRSGLVTVNPDAGPIVLDVVGES